jgi:3-oxoacyl-[acyl-carrier protein] reductase
MDLGIAGRVALVTGASKGIGRAIAQELAAEGARVAIAARDTDRLAQTAAQIGAHPLTYDAEQPETASRLVDAVREELGAVDILVTNTGGPPAAPDALSFGEAEWTTAYSSLLRVPMELIHAAMPGMRRSGFGRVVTVSSTVVREPSPTLMLSNSLRAATLTAFKTLARQVAGDGVTLNSVLPGRIGTQRLLELYGSQDVAEQRAAEEVPAGRLGAVEELAAAAVFLCSARASYITGVGLLVDGGSTHLV